MRRHSANRTLALVATAVFVLAPIAIAAQQAASSQAARTATLHERTKAAGGRLTEAVPDEGESPCATLAELAARSPLIVIGEVLAHRAHLASDQARVTTDVVVKVQERVRGPVAAGALITVTMPGGSYRFPDGAIVHQPRPGYRPIRDRARYLLFLRESRPRTIVRGTVAYELALGPQGQFELDFEKDAVTPAAGERSHPLASRYGGLRIRQLLTELHAAVPR
ncbi:MAG: hypothetical protein A3H96_07070 [Acidobacteria bacterium RIFCSPLOWO2_02_FULL_67_36]|nr:MAG: hypothetical protein A3H96_07070 [Acidobacteria bacterium RIFCSPLOWO2_02_FULL_67_36]OFW26514.1 MAG: hypothetical protein A3G21_24255 [Acidobacteria bacterium RIFCSPLOWO2_12_FULL_66_21]